MWAYVYIHQTITIIKIMDDDDMICVCVKNIRPTF